MQKIRVTKEFSFETAHALWNYNGSCKNLHGHSYKLLVTILGSPIQDTNHPKNGMVIDFSDLKKIIKLNIIDKFDHSLVLPSFGNYEALLTIKQMCEKNIILDFQPTCENLVIYFAQQIKDLLTENLTLHSVTLFETETSYAQWFASDNQ